MRSGVLIFLLNLQDPGEGPWNETQSRVKKEKVKSLDSGSSDQDGLTEGGGVWDREGGGCQT